MRYTLQVYMIYETVLCQVIVTVKVTEMML